MSTRSVATISFSDSADLRRIQKAAKKAGKTVSAFVRDAALKEVEHLAGKCPACGHKDA
jgi:hypothetical protein